MTPEAEADSFNQARFVLFTCHIGGAAHGIAHGQYIGAIDPLTIHVKSASLAIDFGDSRSLIYAQPHTVLIVDDKIDDGQMIDFRKVKRFVERPSVGRAITHLAGHNLAGAAIGQSEGGPGRQWNLSSDNGIAAHEVFVDVKQMHRTATSA